MRHAMAALVIGVLAGCVSHHTVPHEPEGMYRVDAFFAEVDAAQYQQLDLIWEMDTADPVSGLSSRYSTDLLEVLLSSKLNQVDTFPVIILDPGQTRRIDMQRPVTYPISFNEDGSVMEEETLGVGQLIEASIDLEEDGTLVISFLMERRILEYWLSYRLGTINRKARKPVFSSRTLRGAAGVTLDQWLISGGIIRTREDGTSTHFLSAIRVQEN